MIEELISVISDDQAKAIIKDVDYDEDLDESLRNEKQKRNKKLLKEGMFDDIAEDLGYTIYEEDQYGTMYTKTHHVYKNGRDVDWLSTIEVTNDGQCHVDIYDENEYQVGSINSDSFEKAAEYVDKVIRIKQDNPYVTIRESCLKEEWLAEDSFNVEDFVSGFKGTTKFKIRDAEDDVFVCSGNILDGKIVNIQDLVIDKNKIPSLIITSFTIDPKDGTLVLYSYVPEDLF